MNKLIKKYLDAVEAEEIAHDNTVKAEEAAYAAKLPKNLRPAIAKDIVEDAIIWYPDGGEEPEGEDPGRPYWKIVSEVLYPSDRWKAFCATNGCRDGLEGAFVEK